VLAESTGTSSFQRKALIKVSPSWKRKVDVSTKEENVGAQNDPVSIGAFFDRRWSADLFAVDKTRILTVAPLFLCRGAADARVSVALNLQRAGTGMMVNATNDQASASVTEIILSFQSESVHRPSFEM